MSSMSPMVSSSLIIAFLNSLLSLRLEILILGIIDFLHLIFGLYLLVLICMTVNHRNIIMLRMTTVMLREHR